MHAEMRRQTACDNCKARPSPNSWPAICDTPAGANHMGSKAPWDSSQTAASGGSLAPCAAMMGSRHQRNQISGRGHSKNMSMRHRRQMTMLLHSQCRRS